MRINFRILAAASVAVLFAPWAVPYASAGCGNLGQPLPSHSSWQSPAGNAQLMPASLVMVSDSDAGIVGFWHVKFVSKGTKGIPDGTEVDAGYAQWHSDGTEIMNSAGRSPITNAFCLGVWEQVGANEYKLNHFAAAWNATGTALLGPARIQEELTLASDKNFFTGTFTIRQYSETGTVLADVVGEITGTRIDVNTTASSIF